VFAPFVFLEKQLADNNWQIAKRSLKIERTLSPQNFAEKRRSELGDQYMSLGTIPLGSPWDESCKSFRSWDELGGAGGI
jgi:hypothetical protein